jgi:hypothetical protein
MAESVSQQNTEPPPAAQASDAAGAGVQPSGLVRLAGRVALLAHHHHCHLRRVCDRRPARPARPRTGIRPHRPSARAAGRTRDADGCDGRPGHRGRRRAPARRPCASGPGHRRGSRRAGGGDARRGPRAWRPGQRRRPRSGHRRRLTDVRAAGPVCPGAHARRVPGAHRGVRPAGYRRGRVAGNGRQGARPARRSRPGACGAAGDARPAARGGADPVRRVGALGPLRVARPGTRPAAVRVRVSGHRRTRLLPAGRHFVAHGGRAQPPTAPDRDAVRHCGHGGSRGGHAGRRGGVLGGRILRQHRRGGHWVRRRTPGRLPYRHPPGTPA